MRESCSYGSVGAGEGNLPLYPDPKGLRRKTWRELFALTRIGRIVLGQNRSEEPVHYRSHFIGKLRAGPHRR